MTHVGEHAVALGARVAGLAAAAALADRFDRVTIVERDTAAACPRNTGTACPEGRHVHILLPAGRAGLAELLPGVIDDLRAQGARLIDTGEVRFHIAGGSLRLDDADLELLARTRPLLESVVRDRVRAHPGVQFLEHQRRAPLRPDRARGPAYESGRGTRTPSRP